MLFQCIKAVLCINREKPKSELWVEEGLDIFGSAEVEEILKEQLIAWFFK